MEFRNRPLSLSLSFFRCLNVSQDVLAIFRPLCIYLSRTYYRRAYASSSRSFSPELLLNFSIGRLRLICRGRFRGELFSVSRCRYRFAEGIERHAPSLNIVLPVRCHSLVCSTKPGDKIHKRFANNVEEDRRENGNEFDETGRVADCVQRLNGRTRCSWKLVQVNNDAKQCERSTLKRADSLTTRPLSRPGLELLSPFERNREKLCFQCAFPGWQREIFLRQSLAFPFKERSVAFSPGKTVTSLSLSLHPSKACTGIEER